MSQITELNNLPEGLKILNCSNNEYILNYLNDLIELDHLRNKNKNLKKIWTDESKWIFQPNFVYSFTVKIADSDNNIIIITTDIKDNIHLLPKSINEIIKKYKLLQDFIVNYDDDYFLFIYITYFDGYIEMFFIQVLNLKMIIQNKNMQRYVNT
jgi:hypothetical protein